jgi:HAD superfamily hydrolase (TIGR01459 family)
MLNIEDITKPYRGILLDAWGVFWDGNDKGAFSGSVDAMKKLVSSGHIVGILSNNTQLAEKEINKLEKHGIVQGTHYHFFLSSGEIIRNSTLKKKLVPGVSGTKFWVFGGTHPKYFSHKEIFRDSIYEETDNIHEADFIYIGVPHIAGEDQTDPEVFRDEVQGLIKTKLPMICGNPDRFAHEGNPSKLVVRQGAIAEMYEQLKGKVLYYGKPYQQAYAAAMECFIEWGIQRPQEVLMIGDTPETDIRGAKAFGMSSALILETGIMSERIAENGVEDALKGLPESDTPQFYLKRFSYAV